MGSKSLKRLLLTMLSCCMLFTQMTTLKVNAEEATSDSKTETQVIVENYKDNLTSEELAILNSSNIVQGNTFNYSAPTNENSLITIYEGYATLASYTDDSEDARLWVPVSATLIADDGNSQDVRTLEVVEDNGAYKVVFPTDISKEAAITVKAVYKTFVEVDTATQEVRLNTPYWLVNAFESFQAINSAKRQLNVLTKEISESQFVGETYISLLNQLITEGVSVEVTLPNTNIIAPVVVTLNAEESTVAAVVDLNSDVENNGGTFNVVSQINNYVNNYYNEFKVVEFIVNNELASQLHTDAVRTYNNLCAIADSGSNEDGAIYKFINYDLREQYKQETVATALESMILSFSSAKEALAKALTVEAKFAISNISANVLLTPSAVLSDLVENLSEKGTSSAHAASLGLTLTLATAEVDASMGRYSVTVNVSANVIDKEAVDTVNTTALDAKVENKTLTFNDGTSAETVIAAIENEFIKGENGILNHKDWAEYGVNSDNYTASVTKNTIGDTLSADSEYTVIYNPNSFNISDEIDETPETVPYGYNLKLPLYKNEPCQAGEECLVKVYDYTIDGNIYGEGEVVRIVKDTTITRELGKAKESMRLFDVLAEDTDYAMNAESSNILKNSAVYSENVEYRIPDQTDVNKGNIEIKLDDSQFPYVVTAASYESGIPGMVWKPVTWTTNTGATGSFVDGVATIDTDMKKVTVTYELVVTDRDNSGNSKVTDAELLKGLNIPYRLITETRSQINALTRVANQYNALKEANSALSLLLPSLIRDETDADSKKAMERLRDEAFNADGNLIIYDMVKGYASVDGNKVVINKIAAMKDYYANSETYVEQLDLLIEVLPKVKNSTALDSLLVEYPQYADKMDKLDEIAEQLKDAKAQMVKPYNEAIDINNSAVDAIFNIAFDESVAATEYTSLSSNKLTDYAEVSLGVGTVIVPVEVSLGTTSVTGSIDIDSGLWTEEKIDILNAKLEEMAAELATKVGANWQYYVASDVIVNMPSVGDAIDTLNAVEKEFEAKEITVTIVHEETEAVLNTQTISIEDLTVELPAPSNAEISYRFKSGDALVGTSSYGAAGSYSISLEDYKAIFAAGSLELTYSEVNAMIEFFESLNEGIGSSNSGFTLMENSDGYAAVLLIDSAETDKFADILKGAVQNIALNEDFDFIALENSSSDTALMEKITDENGTRRVISMQGMLNALIENSDFSLDKYIGLINENTGVIDNTLGNKLSSEGYKVLVNKNEGNELNLGGSLIETEMFIGANASANTAMPFYISIQYFGNNPKANLELREGLVTMNKLMDFDISNNRVNMNLTLKDRYYQVLLSGMLMTGYTTIEDVTDIDIEEIGTFCKEQLNTILFNEEVTGETLQNTLAQFGYGEAVNESEAATMDKLLGYVRGFKNNTTFEVREGTDAGYKDTYFQALMTTDVSSLVSKMVPEALSGMLKEQTLEIPVEMGMDNLKTAYDAMVLDNSNTGLGKIYFTTDLESIDETLGTNAVVVLLNNVGDITVKNPIILELNGMNVKSLNAEAVTAGTVKVFNSALVKVGTVSSLKGSNYSITGGTFSKLDANMIVDGYRQDEGGVVVSNYFTIAEDEEGNIRLNVSTDYLSTALETDFIYLGTDLALKLGLNFYTTGGLAIGEDADSLNTIYETNFPDLTEQFLLNTKGGMLNEILGVIDCEGSTAFANMLIEDLCDFAAIAEALENGEPVASYAMQLKNWDVNLEVAEDDYITASLGTARPEDKTFSVRVTGAKTDHLVNLFTELDKVAELSGTVSLDKIEYAGQNNGGFEVEYSGNFTGLIDFTNDYRYTALLGIVLSYGLDGDIDSAVQTYFTEGTTDEFIAAFNKLTIGDVMNAVKKAGGVSYSTLISGLTISSTEKTEISKLASLYDTYIRGLDILFTKLDTIERLEIPSKVLNKKLGDSYNSADDSHSINQTWRALSLSGKVKLFAEKESAPEFDITPVVTLSEDLIWGYELDDINGYIDLDTIAAGIKQSEVGTSGLTFSVNNNGVITKIEFAEESTRVRNGEVVTVYAAADENVPESEWVKETFTIRVLGDVNCDGRLNSSDSRAVRRHVAAVEVLTEENVLWAADMNQDGRYRSTDSRLIRVKVGLGLDGYTSSLANK